jgi:hypothetical protein
MANRVPSGLEDHPDGRGNINAVVHSNWGIINGYINPGAAALAKQDNLSSSAGTKVSITNAIDIFSADDVGATIKFADETTCTITAFTTAQQVTVNTTALKAAQAFEVYRTTENYWTALIRGLLKRVRMIAGDDQKILAWDTTLNRVTLIDKPGYAVAAGQVLYGNGTGNDLTSSANFTYASSLLTLNNSNLYCQNIRIQHSTLSHTSAANVTIDFQAAGFQEIAMTAFTLNLISSNLLPGRSVTLYITGAGSSQSIAFPAGWKFTGTKPTAIGSGETWMIALSSKGSADASVYAAASKFV